MLKPLIKEKDLPRCNLQRLGKSMLKDHAGHSRVDDSLEVMGWQTGLHRRLLSGWVIDWQEL